MVYEKNQNIVCRTIHDSVFLIDITDNFSDDVCTLYEINEIGKFIWNNISIDHTVMDIVLLLKQSLTDDISTDLLINDVNEFLNSLKFNNFITLR